MTQPPDDHRTLPEGQSLHPPEQTLAEPGAAKGPQPETVQFLPTRPPGSETPSNEILPTQLELAAQPGSSGGQAGPPPSFALDVPDDLHKHPRYKITRLLGGGGMGIVFHAEHRLMDRPVALKVIHPRYLAHPTAVERFNREVATAGQLRHPNIVTAFDAECIGTTIFLVMEFVEGQTLADYLRQKGKLGIVEACDFIRQAALGLQHAHELKMVHRDIKPENLMRSTSGEIKILDFGLSRFAQEQGQTALPAAVTTMSPIGQATITDAEALAGKSEAATGATVAAESPSTGSATHIGTTPVPASGKSTRQLTLAGAVMGTPDYMAPEQIENTHAADIRSDIYALGCTLYQLLTGQVPFPGGKALDKLERHVKEAPRPLRHLRPDAPPGLAGVLDKMLAKAPGQRYQTPREVAQALAPFATDDDPRKRRRERMFVAAAALFLVGAVAAFLLYWHLTNVGTLRVEAAVPEVAVAVYRADDPDREFARLQVKNGSGEIELPPGDYLLSLPDAPRGLRLLQKKINIARGGVVYNTVEGAVWTVLPVPDPATLANLPSPLDALPAMEAPGHLAELTLKKPMALVSLLGGAAYRLTGPGSFPAFSSDGKLFAVGSGHDVLLMETETGVVKQVFRGHTHVIDDVALSADGKWLASAGKDNAVRLWDVASGMEKRVWVRGAGAVAFSPDSRFLAFAQGAFFIVHALNPKDVDKKRDEDMDVELRISGGFSIVSSVVYHPKGDWVALGLGLRGEVLLYSPAKNEFTQTLYLNKSSSGRVQIAFSPDGGLVAAGNAAALWLWKTPDGRPKNSDKLKVWNAPIAADGLLGFSKDGETLYTSMHLYGASEQPHAISLWDADTGKRKGGFELAASGKIGCYQISPDGRWLAGCSLPGGRVVVVHDLEAKRAHAEVPGHRHGVVGLAFRPGGKELVSVGRDKTWQEWDLSAGVSTLTRGTVFLPEDFALAPDGVTGAVAAWNKSVRLISAGPKKVKAWSHTSMPLRVVFDPEGKALFAAMQDGKVVCYDVENDKDREAYATTTSDLYGLTLDRTGKVLAAAGDKGQIHLWEVGTTRQIATLDGHSTNARTDPSAIRVLASSPDNRWLISAGRDGTIRIWDWEAKTLAHQLHGLTGEATSLALSPDARIVAVGGSDGQILLIDLHAGTPRRLCVRQADKSYADSPVLALAFSPDGRYLAAGCGDGAIPIFRLASFGEIADLSDGTEGLNLLRQVGPLDGINDQAILADGKRVVSVGRDGVHYALRIWSLDSGEDLSVRKTDLAPALLAPSPDGLHVWTVSRPAFNSTLTRWSLADKDKPLEIPLRYDTDKLAPEVLALNGLGQTVIRKPGPARDVIFGRVLDDRGKEIWTLPFPLGAPAAALSADGRRLLVVRDKSVCLLDVPGRRVLKEVPLGGVEPNLRLVFSPDGKRAAWLSDRQTVTVYDLETERVLSTVLMPEPTLRELAISPDKRFLVAAFMQGTIALYDAATGRRVDTARAAPLVRAAFSPDGQYLLTSHLMGKPRLWTMPK